MSQFSAKPRLREESIVGFRAKMASRSALELFKKRTDEVEDLNEGSREGGGGPNVDGRNKGNLTVLESSSCSCRPLESCNPSACQ
jgi:hypothetical protein